MLSPLKLDAGVVNTGSSQIIRCGDQSPKKLSKMDVSPLFEQGETSTPLKAYDIISLRVILFGTETFTQVKICECVIPV